MKPDSVFWLKGQHVRFSFVDPRTGAQVRHYPADTGTATGLALGFCLDSEVKAPEIFYWNVHASIVCDLWSKFEKSGCRCD
jgi:hypothetical protein